MEEVFNSIKKPGNMETWPTNLICCLIFSRPEEENSCIYVKGGASMSLTDSHNVQYIRD